ncbi:MAG: carbohydrate ABC transporter permease [Treponema sp.]|nr:carbohydrate ABC transporter permease [Treponema sp.]
MVKGLADKIFDTVVFILLGLIGVGALFPLLYVLSVSMTPISEVLKGGFLIIPKKITWAAYKEILNTPLIPRSMYVTAFITVVGTLISLFLTVLMAYPLSRHELPGRSIVVFLVVFTMLFSGGVIPTYILVRNLGLINSIWAMILPGAMWTFNVVLAKSFLENLPNELIEASRIDGAGESIILIRIVLPLSLPMIMTIGLYFAVGQWNLFFAGIMYITKPNLYPLQVIIRQILMQSQNLANNPDVIIPTRTMQMAAIIVASVPMLLVYPFIQKYFTKGIFLGAIK